jgi:iron complex outermembrane recepter protein
VTDELAQVSRFAQCAETICGLTPDGGPGEIYIVPQRPRMIGLKFSQEF